MKVKNKKAFFNYKLEPERVEAGISLTGGEAKALRTGRFDFSNAHARILDGEIYLVNVNIPIEGKKDYNPTRSRKLLLHRKEIVFLETKMKQRKLTLVPISLYTKRRLVKVELALGKGKRKFEKRQTIKKRDINREIEKEMKA